MVVSLPLVHKGQRVLLRNPSARIYAELDIAQYGCSCCDNDNSTFSWAGSTTVAAMFNPTENRCIYIMGDLPDIIRGGGPKIVLGRFAWRPSDVVGVRFGLVQPLIKAADQLVFYPVSL